MKILFLSIATAKEEWSHAAIDLYLRKMNPFHPTEYKTLKPKKYSREDADVKRKEDTVCLLKELTADDYVILFDERGKKFNSQQFSKNLEMALMSGKKRIVFIVGGAFGVSDELRSRAQAVVGLSDMIMNHLVAQVVVMEQVYRGFTILKNLPYHNQD